MKKLTIFLFVMVLAFGGVGLAGATSYSIIDLGKGDAKDINELTQVVGDGYIWDEINGRKNIGSGSAQGVNNSSQVVGQSGSHAYIWDETNGMRDLGSLYGWSTALDINDLGQAVGRSLINDTTAHAIIWDETNGMRDLGSLGGWSVALGINNLGQVVGNYSPPGSNRAFIWDEVNGMRDIDPVLDYSSDANDINDLGQVVGDYIGSGGERAYIWDEINGVKNLGTLGRANVANCINNTEKVVGFFEIAGSDDHAFIWDEANGMRDLNDLIIAGTGWVLINGRAINDLNQIVGYGRIDGEIHAFLLTPIPENQPPIADAGPDQTVECTGLKGTMITLDGSGSSDPDSTSGTNDDIVSFKWYEAEILIGDSEVLDYLFEVDTHPITLEVTDSYGETDSDLTNIIIQDTTPPSISVSVSPDILWPPNHKMVHVTTTVTATDNCDSEPAIKFVSIVMNESDETITFDPNYDFSVNDGQTLGDIQKVDDFNFYLRCERSGKSNGRTYTITYKAIDDSGNESTAFAEVLVPHSM